MQRKSSARQRLSKAMISLALTMIAAAVFAQANPVVSPPVAPAAPAAPSTPVGTGIIPYGAAAPQPNPNLSYNAALPDRRGFFREEPFFIYPFVGLGYGHNNNLTGTNVAPISSSFWVLSPRVIAELKSGSHTNAFTYSGNFGRYQSSSPDNFNEHEFVATTSNQFTARSDLTARAYYLIKSDPRGLLNRPFSAEPDRWNAVGADATYGYGALSAQGRFEFDLGFTDKQYQNNRDITELWDISTLNFATRFFYRIAPRTRLLAEFRDTEYDYKSSSSLLDNSEQRYLVGATWDIAAATSGTVKLGYMTKNFKDPSLKDYSGGNLEATIRWLPRTYSLVDFIARRSAVDSSGTGIFTVDTTVGAIWNHHWWQYFSTRALATHVNSEFQGLSRTDRISTLTLGGYFDVRTWLRLGAEVTRQTRDSTDPTAEFKRNLLLFTVGATL
jgi:polysaccharide biosynthesis protein VpsM